MTSVKRSVTIAGHRTSITLESAFWVALKEVAEKETTTINRLIAKIDAAQPDNLSSAIRIYLLDFYKARAR